MHSLSKDRWKIVDIRNDELVGGCKEKLWAKQKDDHTKAAKFWKDKNEKKRAGVPLIYTTDMITLSKEYSTHHRKEKNIMYILLSYLCQ